MIDWTGGQIKNDDSADDVKHVDLTQVHCTLHGCALLAQSRPITSLRHARRSVRSDQHSDRRAGRLAQGGVPQHGTASRRRMGCAGGRYTHDRAISVTSLAPRPQASPAPSTRTTAAASSPTTTRRSLPASASHESRAVIASCRLYSGDKGVLGSSILPIAYRRIAVTIRYWSAMMRHIIFAYINNDAVIYSRSTVLLRRLRFGRHLRARAQLMPRRRMERADEFAEARSGR